MDEMLARTMVETLAKGIDPVSGLALPDDHLCNNEDMQEALEIVLENCTIESYKDMLARKKAEKAEARRKKRELAIRRNMVVGELRRIPINVAKAPPYKPSSSKSQHSSHQKSNDQNVESWTIEEESRLRELNYDHNVWQIAIIMNRSAQSVSQKLLSMGASPNYFLQTPKKK